MIKPLGERVLLEVPEVKEEKTQSGLFVPDTVKEIGSSAFRKCKSLTSVSLPSGVSVNERAFKESPTQITYR